MKLSDVMAVWDILHIKSVGDLGFYDLERAIDKIVGVENDLAPNFGKIIVGDLEV